MSWLDVSPKRQAARSKAMPGSTRTYGSGRLPTSSNRGAASRGLFRSQAGPGMSYGSTSVVLSATYEEEAKSPPAESISSRLSPGFDSSPSELAFSTNRSRDLDLGSPNDTSPIEDTVKAGKTKKRGGRARKATTRTRTASSSGTKPNPAARGSSADPVILRDEASAPRRKEPAAGRKTRAARGATGSARLNVSVFGEEDETAVASGTERHQPSPTARRDRSPARRGAGRPERWGDRAAAAPAAARKPSPSLQSPLRPITNYSSEGDRSQRGSTKVGGGGTRAARGDTSSSGGGGCSSSSNSGGNSSNSSGEEEWQDDGMDFSSKRDANPDAQEDRRKGGRGELTAGGRRRKVGTTRAAPTRGARAAARDRIFPAAVGGVEEYSSDSDGVGKGEDGADDMEELDDDEIAAMERVPTPPPPLSPGDPISREVCLSLDSSVEGILVGDKRPRGGKRDARAVEDSAHRSSRSRHLSPNIPVSGGFANEAFSVLEENESDLDDAIGELAPAADVIDTTVRNASTSGKTRQGESLFHSAPHPAAAASATAPSAPSAHHRRAFSATAFKAHSSAPSLSLTSSPALLLQRQQCRRASMSGTQAEAAAASVMAQAAVDGELAEWGGDSPPARLSRSLSLSQSSASSAWGGGGSGCAKVTRSSFRRRSRASSTSSPLPVLETSASMPTGGVAELAASGSWSTRSVGSGGLSRADLRKRRGSTNAIEELRSRSSGEMSVVNESAPLVRSHRMRGRWSQGSGERTVGDRPNSLPSGFVLGETRAGDGNPAAAGMGRGDSGVGWVLRAPGAPLGRYRSQSLASGKASIGLSRSRSDITPGPSLGTGSAWVSRFSSAEGSTSTDGQSSEQRPRDSEAFEEKAVLDPGTMGNPHAQTPRASAAEGTSAAQARRAHGLSSVARRMDRLVIRSPDVETHATQAQQAILGSPMGPEDVNASAAGTASAGTPARPRPFSLPTHLTPVGNWNSTTDRSRLSGVGASPTECLRDYLSGQQGQEEEEEEAVAGDHARDGRNAGTPAPRAAAAASAAATGEEATSSPDTNSPPGITFTRSAALGLPSPIAPPGLFGGKTEHGDGYAAKGNIGAAGDSHTENLRGKESRSEGAVDDASEGGAGSRAGPSHPRKGSKLGPGQRSRTVPVSRSDRLAAGTRGSPEGGFLIRRKTLGHSSASSSTWPKAFGDQEREDDVDAPPPALPRVSSGSGSSSLYLSCLSSGADIESPVEKQEERCEVSRRSRSISSPLPFTAKVFDTPSAFASTGGVEASGDDGEEGGKGSAEGSRGLEATAEVQSTQSVASAERRSHCSPASGFLGAPRAAQGLSDSNPRRTSTESVGPTTSSRAQFETPQAENKCRWGSRPQYGDWGISQPASAGALQHLANRLMVIARRAPGARLSGGSTDPDLPPGDMASPSSRVVGTPLRATTPLDDLKLPRTTPGSNNSSRGSGAYAFRNSLGTLSERGEGRDAAAKSDGDGDGDGEEGVAAEEGSGEKEKEAVLDEGTGVVDGVGGIWGASAVAAAGERVGRREGSFGGRPARSRLSGLLMTEAQRDLQRRRQSKAKMRRVSLSIKSRRSSVGIASHLAGLSIVEAAEAASPTVAKTEQRQLHGSPSRKGGAGFGGGVISEGEDEDDDEDEEPRVLQAAPPANAVGHWCRQPSPMSVEKRAWAGQPRVRSQEEARGDTPVKVREDLEKSLTELNNLSLSMCSEDDGSPEKPSSEFMISPGSGLELAKPSQDAPSAAALAPPPVDVWIGRQALVANALCMLSVNELLGETPLVCTAWRTASVLAFAEVASDMGEGAAAPRSGEGGGVSGAGEAPGGDVTRTLRTRSTRGKQAAVAPSPRDVWSLEKLMATFSWGGFLSQGGSKKVYKVWNAAHSRMEALSVMDREEIAGEEDVVSQEVRVSILASSLVQRNICPNFVQTFGLFRCASPLPADVFGTEEDKYPCGRSPGIIRAQPRGAFSSGTSAGHGRHGRSKHPAASSLRYQFIGMELCEYDDAERFIKNQRNRLLPSHEVQGFLFQMAFALYAGRAELHLRHFDIKLLNFFVGDALKCSADGVGDEEGVALRYGLGQEVVELHLPQDRAFLVKLADFGTGDVNPLTVGDPVDPSHFTTLENTPIEQLCCGSEARQGYASDTFSLSLAAIHLFTGEAPYEEIMEEVECPDDLYDTLATTWNAHAQYVDLLDIIIGGDDEDEESEGVDADEDAGQEDPTLFNTFYRYLVLFGVPERETLEEAFGRNNPIWKAVGALLGWKPAKSRGGGGRGRRAAGSSAASKRFRRHFKQDRAVFSLETGTNPYIKRARARLEAMPGAVDLVRSMASFAPAARPTMLEVLRSEVFGSLRGSVDGGGGNCLEFMTFARREGDKPLVNI